MPREKDKPTIRILLLGATGVGKNCLESRFTTMTYPPSYNPSLTINSRRYYTLSQHSSLTTPPSPPSSPPLTGRPRPRSASSTISNPRTPPPPPTPPSPEQTYLLEITNSAIPPTSKQPYDAILLIYDVSNRATFDLIPELASSISLTKAKIKGGRKSVRRRTSGFFEAGKKKSVDDRVGGETVVALVGNKSDFDAEYASVDGVEVRGEKEREGVEGRGLVHPLFRGELDATEEVPMSPGRGMSRRRDGEVPLSPRSVQSNPIGVHQGTREDGKKTETSRSPEEIEPVQQTPATVPKESMAAIEKWLEVDCAMREAAERKAEEERTGTRESEKTRVPKREVSEIEGEMLARSLLLNVPFFETSARTGENVEDVFEAVVREVLREMGRDATPEASVETTPKETGGQTLTRKRSVLRKNSRGEEPLLASPVSDKPPVLMLPELSEEGHVITESPVDSVMDDTALTQLETGAQKRKRDSVIGSFFKRVFSKKPVYTAAEVAA